MGYEIYRYAVAFIKKVRCYYDRAAETKDVIPLKQLLSLCTKTLWKNGSTRGITSISKPEGYWKSKSLMEHKVIGLLAGKAATEIMCHVADVGVASDIKRAFSIVDDYCSYGFDSFVRHDSSETISSNKDRMLDSKFYEKEKELIVDNQEFLMAVVEELLDKKTLTNADLNRIQKELGF